MGRLRDAFRVLQGRSEAQIEITRMKTQWAELMLDVANLMDKLASMVGRLSKREGRKAAKKLEPTPEPVSTASVATTRWERKAQLRRRRLGKQVEQEQPPELEEAEG